MQRSRMIGGLPPGPPILQIREAYAQLHPPLISSNTKNTVRGLLRQLIVTQLLKKIPFEY
jgi:hypothetical protein